MIDKAFQDVVDVIETAEQESPKQMSFDEEFPSLKEKVNIMGYKNLTGEKEEPYLIDIKDIQEFCLDKQRLREAIDKRLALGEPEILVIAMEALQKELGLK